MVAVVVVLVLVVIAVIAGKVVLQHRASQKPINRVRNILPKNQPLLLCQI